MLPTSDYPVIRKWKWDNMPKRRNPYIISIHMENGSAWVECFNGENEITLPDSTDKALNFELNDALIEAINDKHD